VALNLFIPLLFLMYAGGAVGGPGWVSWMADVVPARVRGRYFSRRRQWSVLTALPAAWFTGWLLDRYDDHDRDSGDWPIRLVFMVEAATRLEDIEVASQLRPLMAEYTGLNLLAGQFAAVFGSADRYLGRLDSLLGDGSPEDRFEAAFDLDVRTEALLHQAETLAFHVAHLRTTGKAPARAQQLTEQALAIAEPRGLWTITLFPRGFDQVIPQVLALFLC